MADITPELRQRIAALIQSDDVVLFMKGTRDAPQCRYSAAVVEILDGLLPGYRTVDVLADPAVREGIKVYSDWPTIPQLYVRGELIGGADITREMFAAGTLQQALRVASSAPSATADAGVTLTAAAAEALRGARDAEVQKNPAHRFLRVSVSGRFAHGLCFGPELEGDVGCTSEGIDVRVDKASAARARGLRIDAQRAAAGGVAFSMNNPNQPVEVKQLGPKELKALLDAAKQAGKPIELFDVRSQGERDIARIEGAVLFDDAARARMQALPKDTPLYFHCHHGGRSQHAAEHALAQGFKDVTNLRGGIDAWSMEVDDKVRRY